MSVSCVVMGNTFYYMLDGPLRNLELISEISSSTIFGIVLQADFMSDIFYWITAFTWTFMLLTSLRQNQGQLQTPKWKLIVGRIFRLAPLYYFMILFLWKFIGIFGGKGPRFYQFEENHGCSDSWFWHFIFLNNILPWKQSSNCIQETWYIANDIQFFMLLVVLAELYYTSRGKFYLSLISIFLVTLALQLIVILKNDLTASYLAHKDEYWTLYYDKPFTRIQGYLFGIFMAC